MEYEVGDKFLYFGDDKDCQGNEGYVLTKRIPSHYRYEVDANPDYYYADFVYECRVEGKFYGMLLHSGKMQPINKEPDWRI